MKKHDEGYVLAYVTVILLLFCLIATGILTGAMKNMTNQQDTIQRMKDRYAAEGMIQQITANWNAISWGSIEVDQQLPDYPNVTFMGQNGEYVKLSVTCNSVVITCEVDSSGKYQTFEIGTAPVGEVSP